MNIQLVSFGIVLLLAGYSIGINQRKQVMNFLKRRHVREGRKVTEILGSSQFVLGAALITFGGIGFRNAMPILCLTLFILLALSMYIMNRFVD